MIRKKHKVLKVKRFETEQEAKKFVSTLKKRDFKGFYPHKSKEGLKGFLVWFKIDYEEYLSKQGKIYYEVI